MADKIAIRVQNVSKDFVLPHEKVSSVKSLFTGVAKRRGKKGKETQHALKDISFEVKKGEFFGIVGRNGSGKSTLLKIIARIYQPTKGSLEVSGKLVPFIELGVGFNPELTGRENVFLNGALLGFSEREVSEMYQDIVDFAELERFMDQKLKNYSSGMQVRLAFSVAVRAKADILLIDEVLAVGDADFQRKCYEYFNYLKRKGITVVFVSHDVEAVRQYCDKVILIEKNEIFKSGSADDVTQEYTKLFSAETAAFSYEEQEKRWGEGQVTIDKIDVKVLPNEVIIHETLKANKDVEDCTPGIMIKSTKGESVMGTNSRRERKKIGALLRGETVNLEWRMPNILSRGNFLVTAAIHNVETTVVYDWWDGAASFSIKKERESLYPVDPDIKLKIEGKQ